MAEKLLIKSNAAAPATIAGEAQSVMNRPASAVAEKEWPRGNDAPVLRAPLISSSVVHVPAAILKDTKLSARARLLYATLCAFADGRTHRTYVGTRKLEELLKCGRVTREKAERELRDGGHLSVMQERQAGRFGKRWYEVRSPRKYAAVRNQDNGA